MQKTWLASVLLMVFGSLMVAGTAHAGGSWLDGPPIGWNQVGSPIPAAPLRQGLPPGDPLCAYGVRSPETPEDLAIVSAGWTLLGGYQGGWGIRVVSGFVGHDGMCRPVGFQ